MRTLVGALAVLATAPAFAEELPAQLAPAGKAVELEAGTLVSDGDGRRMREIARTPGWLWGSARAFVPLESNALWGQLRLEATTLGTGQLWLDLRFAGGSHLVLRASRHRFPYASVARAPGPPPAGSADALDRLEQTREQVEVSWSRALGPLGGHLDAAADFQRFAGTQPVLAAGLLSTSPLVYSFGAPAYHRADDLTGGATVGYSAVPGGARVGIAGGVRFDRLDNRLLIRDGSAGQAAGLADLHDTARSRTLAVEVTAASDQPGSLMAGGSYGLRHTASAPNVDHATVQSAGSTGAVRSGDTEVRILRQHGVAGLVWQPSPRLRLAGRLDARLTDLDAQASQTRDLGTPQVVRVDSSRDNWSLDGRLQGRLGLLGMSAVEVDARGGLRRGEDDWNLRYLLADGITAAGERGRALDRHLLRGAAELRLVTRPLPRVRATVGSRLEGLRSDEEATRLVDAFRLGNRSRFRAGAFAAAQTRVLRRFAFDGRASLFRDTWEARAGGKDINWRFDVRLRATAAIGPVMVFLLGSLTEDRHDLAGGEAQPGFASLDFIGRSWLALGGATANLGSLGWASATYTLVANTTDLTTRLHDAGLTVATPLPWRRLRLQLTARYLDFRDHAPWVADGRAALALLTLAGGR